MGKTDFKTRFNDHKLSCKHNKNANKMVLSKFIWELEENKEEYKVESTIVERVKPYKSGGKTCKL